MKANESILSILLRRRGALALINSEDTNYVNKKHILALQAEVGFYGYSLSKQIIKKLKKYSKEDLKELHYALVSNLNVMCGGDLIDTKPLFVNFPENIPEDNDYLRKRIVGFYDQFNSDFSKKDNVRLSCGHKINLADFDLSEFGACPICQHQVDNKDLLDPKKRPALEDKITLKEITLIKETEKYNILAELLSSVVPLSQRDLEDIQIIIENSDEKSIIASIPEDITVKETLAKFIQVFLSELEEEVVLNILKEKSLTATDILRLAVALSNGDISLSKATRFKSFSNRERRLILSLLDSVNDITEMGLYIEEWKRVGEKIHPGSYAKKYPKALEGFNIVRNHTDMLVSFDSKVESLLEDKEYLMAANLLSTKPGLLMRRMDLLLRKSKKKDQKGILKIFKLSVQDMPTNGLIHLRQFFKSRTKKTEFRSYVPKGLVEKMFIDQENNLKPLKKSVVKELNKIIKKSLLTRFKTEDFGKKVFIDPRLKECLVPQAQRSASASLVKIARGSALKLDISKTIRFFTYWKGFVDLDLSVSTHSNNWDPVSFVNYQEMSDKKVGIKHSGDIQNAPKGASEFIDINLKKAKKAGVRYVVMSVNSYSGEPFEEFKTFGGFMYRSKPKSGEIYEPKTVQNKFDFEGNSKYIIPVILDLEKEEIIIADTSITVDPYTNINNEESKVVKIAEAVLNYRNTKANLFDLFKMHAKANKAKIDTEYKEYKDYDHIFGVEEGVTPFNIEKITSNWLK